MSSAQNLGNIKRSHRKAKTQKSESEEYDSLGSDTESGSAEHIRSRLEQTMTLEEHETTNFISNLRNPLKNPEDLNSFDFILYLFPCR